MEKRRLMFFFLANILAILLLIYILDMAGVINYREWLREHIPSLAEKMEIKPEDPLLLEKLELQKRWELLKVKQEELKKKEQELKDAEAKIKTEKENIKKEKLKVQQAISNIEIQKKQEMEYQKQVETVARRLLNMPILDAVKLLNKMDDMFVIDIFKEMDRIAEDQGIMSSVPEYLRRMDPDKAARIQRKMLVQGLENR